LSRGVFLGVDVGGTNAKVAVLDGRGRLTARKRIPTRPSEGPEALFRRIRETLPALRGGPHRLTAVGVGCAGLIDGPRGFLYSSPNLPDWTNTPIRRIAQKVFGVYTCIDNDANVAAYGEYHRGVGRARLLVCLTLGTGVGGGIVSEGQILRGADGYAGEIGHMTLNERGPRCKCGSRGCVEAYLGADALVAAARRRLRRTRSRLLRPSQGSLSPQLLARAARQGDRVAIAVLEEAGGHLGTAVASIANVLNPDRVVIGGGVAGAFGIMRRRVLDVVRERAFAESARNLKVTRASLGANAAAMGAALLARSIASGATLRPRGR
jgi:glucokinase